MFLKQRLIFLYIFAEMLPTFAIGLVIFIFTLLSFQTLRLTEFLLIHGVELKNLVEMVFYLSIRFLPMITPMSLLFACLFTFNRLSNDSEIIAMKSSGLSTAQISIPAISFGIIVFIFSLYSSFYIGPWGTKSFDKLVAKIGQTKASANIREGSFSEGFFDMVVYANKVDTKTGKLADLFIYDERSSTAPLTIVSKFGQIIQDKHAPDQFALLRLLDGEIHKSTNGNYTIINFKTYDINLSTPLNFSDEEFSPEAYNISELHKEIERIKAIDEKTPTDKEHFIQLSRAYHKRWALSFSCLIFTLLGVALGAVTNHRAVKSNGYVISLSVLVIYWILFIIGDQSVKSGKVPAYIGLWVTNILFLIFTYKQWKKTSKT